jgi:hypothetical protein
LEWRQDLVPPRDWEQGLERPQAGLGRAPPPGGLALGAGRMDAAQPQGSASAKQPFRPVRNSRACRGITATVEVRRCAAGSGSRSRPHKCRQPPDKKIRTPLKGPRSIASPWCALTFLLPLVCSRRWALGSRLLLGPNKGPESWRFGPPSTPRAFAEIIPSERIGFSIVLYAPLPDISMKTSKLQCLRALRSPTVSQCLLGRLSNPRGPEKWWRRASAVCHGGRPA